METRFEVFDAIGEALKRRYIDFTVATELRDLVRVGKIDEVKEQLKRYRQDGELSSRARR